MTRDSAGQRSGEGYSILGYLTDEKKAPRSNNHLIILPPPSLFVQGAEQFHFFSATRERAGVWAVVYSPDSACGKRFARMPEKIQMRRGRQAESRTHDATAWERRSCDYSQLSGHSCHGRAARTRVRQTIPTDPFALLATSGPNSLAASGGEGRQTGPAFSGSDWVPPRRFVTPG